MLGDLLRRPLAEADCSFANGFLAGGYGDFCVVPDRAGQWFTLHHSCYLPDESRQGVSVARYPVAARERPAGLEFWRDGKWQSDEATPLFAVTRGWRHRDPAAYWGPAVHYNRALDLFVMLLNRTQDGNADIVQRGVYVTFNADPGDPAGWSPPLQIVEDGSWYPQAIGTGADEGDTVAGGRTALLHVRLLGLDAQVPARHAVAAGAYRARNLRRAVRRRTVVSPQALARNDLASAMSHGRPPARIVRAVEQFAARAGAG